MRVTVNQDYCEQAGECLLIAPAVFSRDAAGVTVVAPEEVPAELEDDVRTAADYCPRLAIALVTGAP